MYTVRTVQLAGKFTAHVGQHTYLSRFFARRDELHPFHTQVSRLLVHATVLTSYATCGLYIPTRIPMPVKLPMHTNLLAICVTQ